MITNREDYYDNWSQQSKRPYDVGGLVSDKEYEHVSIWLEILKHQSILMFIWPLYGFIINFCPQ